MPPWEKYQDAPASGPWAKYAEPQAAEDPITAQVRSEYEADKAKGVPVGAGYTRRAVQGLTMNAADEVLAGLQTPLEMIRRGTLSPVEGYKYAKAREDVELEEARKSQGWLGTAAEMAGSVGSGIGLARAGVGAATRLGANAGLGARAGAMAIDGAAIGGVSGAMEGNSLGERASNAGFGMGTGAALGAGLPAIGAVAGPVVAPIVSNIRARINPAGVAQSQVARAMMESSASPRAVIDDVARAAQEGQGVYTVADALGNSGQRMLSTVARAPGPGRTQAVEFLEARQADQGRRVSGALAEGFDAPQTAAQTEARLTQARDTRANAEYGQVRSDAAPVDLSRAIARIDETLGGQIVNPNSGIAQDSVEAALQSFRNRMTDGRSNLTDFTAVQRVRGDLSDAATAAERAGHGNKARLLRNTLREMDTAMEAASVGHRQANANFAQGSRTIEAVGEGRTAATRGRTEDTIPAFRAMTPAQQQAYRAGYVDPLIAQTQGAAFGANKARPFTSDAFRNEAAAIAPMRTGPLLDRRLAREHTMFETRRQATGGSQTADNLADAAAAGIDPSVIMNLLHGNFGGAARSALTQGSNALNGNTSPVREEIARLLLARGNDAQHIEPTLRRALERSESVQRLVSLLTQGAVRGGAYLPVARPH